MAPRARLSVDRIVDAAAEVVDAEGLDRLTLGAVATALGVRTPSLYNHVGGLDDLRRLLTVRGITELGAALQRATVGRSGDDAVRSLAHAARAFARERPGLYATTVPTSEVDDDGVREAGAAVVGTVLAVLAAYDLDEQEAVHAARGLRAAVHGFVALEHAGGFGLPTEVEASFDWLTALLTDGIRARTGARA